MSQNYLKEYCQYPFEYYYSLFVFFCQLYFFSDLLRLLGLLRIYYGTRVNYCIED